jgi:predicted ATP-dependent endonuclease of OLD family
MTECDVHPKKERLSTNLGNKTVAEHLDDIPKYYYHETTFSSSDADLFFAKKALLVEGPVEKYGFPRLAAVMGARLSHLTIISCNGKTKIPHYATVCQAFAIPAFVLFDLDKKGTTERDSAMVIESAAGFSLLHFESSFEELLGISANTEHKASKALERVDSIKDPNDVPQEIAQAISEIAKWCGGE